MLRHLAGAPVVVVLDDVQWVDEASAEALRLAFGHLDRDPVLVVAAARSGASPHWERLVANHERGRRIALAGLTSEDLRRLASKKGKAIEPFAARRLYLHTAGNPLHASALMDELELGALARGWGPLPAPGPLARSVACRLRACSPPSQALVQAVAVLGSPAFLDTARLLADLEDPVDPLEEATAAKLLVEVAGSSYAEVAFAEPLAAVAVYSQISRESRSHLHVRAAALTDGEACLHHQVEAARAQHSQADALAEHLEDRASHELESGSLRLAALHLDQAASLTRPGGLRSRRLVAAADALLALGDVAGAQARLQEADLGAGSRKSLLTGMVAFLGGRASAAERCLEAAWGQGHQDQETTVAARAAWARAIVAVSRGQADEATWWATRPRAGPSGAGGASILAATLGQVLTGRTDEALSGFSGMEDDPESRLARGLLRMWTDDLAGAREDLYATVGLVEDGGHLLQLGSHALGFLAEAEYRAGRWQDALAHADRAAGQSEQAGRHWDAAFIHAIAARPLLAMGDWTIADVHVRASSHLAESFPVEMVVACAGRARAAQAMALGHHRVALDAVRMADRALSPAEPAFFPDGPVEALALIALDRLGEAEDLLDAFEAQVVAVGRRSPLAQAARARGLLAAARGQVEEAKGCFDAGLVHVGGLGMPFEMCQLRLDLARVLIRVDQLGDAREQLEQALPELVELGAQPHLAICRRLLDEVPTVLPPMADPQRLTPTELRVAGLVADGLKRWEVAERLTVSTKTVDSHLHQVFRKLKISRREDLAGRLRSVASDRAQMD